MDVHFMNTTNFKDLPFYAECSLKSIVEADTLYSPLRQKSFLEAILLFSLSP